MTPRRSTYKPPRPRHEVVVAAAASVGLTVLTVVAVWALGPHSSSTAPSTPTLTAPPTLTPGASTPASSTPSTPTTPSTPPSS